MSGSERSIDFSVYCMNGRKESWRYVDTCLIVSGVSDFLAFLVANIYDVDKQAS